MLKIVLAIAALVVLAIAGLLIYATTRPDTFRVARTTQIQAAPERIFPLINDLTAWKAWSPFEKKDPDMQRSFSGPAAGTGARYAWAGDKNIGEGSMEIVDSLPSSKVAIRLDFLKPFRNSAMAELTLQPAANGSTTVTWTMSGDANYLAKVMHLVFDIDAMIGRDFEAGLADLKQMAEK